MFYEEKSIIFPLVNWPNFENPAPGGVSSNVSIVIQT